MSYIQIAKLQNFAREFYIKVFYEKDRWNKKSACPPQRFARSTLSRELSVTRFGQRNREGRENRKYLISPTTLRRGTPTTSNSAARKKEKGNDCSRRHGITRRDFDDVVFQRVL